MDTLTLDTAPLFSEHLSFNDDNAFPFSALPVFPNKSKATTDELIVRKLTVTVRGDIMECYHGYLFSFNSKNKKFWN